MKGYRVEWRPTDLDYDNCVVVEVDVKYDQATDTYTYTSDDGTTYTTRDGFGVYTKEDDAERQRQVLIRDRVNELISRIAALQGKRSQDPPQVTYGRSHVVLERDLEHNSVNFWFRPEFRHPNMGISINDMREWLNMPEETATQWMAFYAIDGGGEEQRS